MKIGIRLVFAVFRTDDFNFILDTGEHCLGIIVEPVEMYIAEPDEIINRIAVCLSGLQLAAFRTTVTGGEMFQRSDLELSVDRTYKRDGCLTVDIRHLAVVIEISEQFD